jgi:cell division protein FtsQ
MQSLSLKFNTQSEVDPAPSRINYRFQRLWLMRSFRLFIKWVSPLLLCAAFICFCFTNEKTLSFFKSYSSNAIESFVDRPELLIKLISIEEASQPLERIIRDTLPISLPISGFDFNLTNIREVIESLDAVKSVDVRVIAGGILNIRVLERMPAFVWRNPKGLFLLDKEGTIVGEVLNRARRSDLPLVTGVGADVALTEITNLINLLKPIENRVVAYSRISEDRWDIVLDRSQRISLPSEKPELAVGQFLILNQSENILHKKVERIDFRNKQRLTLTLRDNKINN